MISDNEKFNMQVKPNSVFLNELKSKLPEFFDREGNFDLDKFKGQLKEHNINELSDGYQLNFIGKDYARRQAGEMPSTVIVPDEEQNNGEGKDSKNLFFTGDNLEVLRHLQNNYAGKIDVIYIDPPYNTGNKDFVYPDKFEYSDGKLKEMFGMDDVQVERLKSIQGKSSHSAWLTFMYPRLYLAKNLLSKKGVIFVSIDDNEYANLYEILTDIYGEIQVDTLIWNKESEGKSGTLKAVSQYRRIHEYIVVAYVNKKDNKFNKIHEALEGRENEFNTANLAVNGSNEDINHSNYFTLTSPNGKKYTRQWKWSKEKINELINEDLIYWGKDGEKQPRLILPMDERRTVYLSSILNYGSTTSGREDFEKLFSKDIFSYPKPIKLLKKILEATTSKESIILDFFAGSSTTAEAVMQLNAKDSGSRRYIMIQIPESTFTVNSNGEKIPAEGGKTAYEAGFKSIDEISRERIRRAAAKIKADNDLTLPKDFDGSFKHYRVVNPTKQTLEDIEDFDPDNTTLFTDMVDSFSSKGLDVAGDATGEQTILTTWLAKDGYSFDANIKKIDFDGYEASLVEDSRLYIINNGWSSVNTKSLLNKIGTHQIIVQTIVLFGYSFNIADLRELEIGLKQLDNNINLLKRY